VPSQAVKTEAKGPIARVSMRLPVARLLLLACALVLVVPASAMAASKHVVYPVVKKVSPLKISVGDQLTIRGTGFRAGRAANTVVFKRDGKPAVFVKSGLSTKKKIYVTVPDKVAAFLVSKDGAAAPARFRLRVLSSRFSKHFTSTKLSPLVKPKAGSSTPDTGSGYKTCQQTAPATPAADADSDGLPNAIELAYGVDPCTADTDSDGMLDGYEYQSAIDLNGSAIPYPGRRPWPNPLDGSDGGWDFDGDGLTLSEEYRLWKFVGGAFPVTAYSDGTQSSGGVLPATATPGLDIDGDGKLTDDERDADADSLSNVVEYKYRGVVGWWSLAYPAEKPYTAATFNEPDPIVSDTDGDGVTDGADDQDHDGYDNYTEMERTRTQLGLRIQPYNPCLPDPHSRVCSRYVPFANPWPPFDGSQSVGDDMPFLWPRPGTASGANPWDGTGGT
jgi:IPT/TIG domain